MISAHDLMVRLEEAKTGAPAVSVESAIAIYQMASAVADEFAAVKEAAKQMISDVMAETGQTAYTTAAGKAVVTAPSVTVAYDAKALDILLRDDADLAMRLAPYRKESLRAGTLRITALK